MKSPTLPAMEAPSPASEAEYAGRVIEAAHRPPVAPSFTTNFLIALVAFAGGGLAITFLAGHDPALHTVLDTSVTLTAALVALLLWDISRRTDESWALFLAITFSLLTLGELLHVLAVLGWLGGGQGADVQLRAGTWGPPAHLLPVGVAAALLFRDRDRSFAWVFGSALGLLALGLVAIFLTVPRYTPPGLFGITRPSLVLVPMLWVGVGIAYWRRRRDTAFALAIAASAVIFAASHLIILYSRAPSDPTAMAAHYGKFIGDALLLFSLTQIGAADTARRRQLEGDLRGLNMELEDLVQERAGEVKKARDVLDAVVENLPDMVFLKETDGFAYVLINKAGETLLGRSRSEILGKTDADLLPATEAEQFLQDSQAAAAAGQPRIFPDRHLTNPTGVRTVESRKVPIGNGSGAPLVLGIVRDVTNSRSMEEQLRQLQRMDAIGQLTGGVAHDFNNLLAIIHGNSEVLRDRIDGDADSLEMVDDVLGAAERGAELVRRLLAFARMQHLAPEPIDLQVRLQKILGLLQRSLGENVKVRINPAPQLWPAIVDATQVDDAMVNLAINARDAMPDGGTLTIETQNVTLDEDYAAQHLEVAAGDYVLLAVSDTGTGMAPDVVAHAFEPFFTTKAEGKGTGLGLSQVFGWVKQSGGHIKIYSELGHGTTFKLYLPRAKSLSAEPAERAKATSPRGDEMILVVEDNPGVRKAVIRQLHDFGYRTVEADSGAAALALVQGGIAFDLLLTDVIMPGGITGYQLVDELRLGRPDLKVLFTSGYTELAASPDRPAGKDPLLSKPYRKQDLGRAVRAVLD